MGGDRGGPLRWVGTGDRCRKVCWPPWVYGWGGGRCSSAHEWPPLEGGVVGVACLESGCYYRLSERISFSITYRS